MSLKRCTHCNGIFDEIDVKEVVARYADCDVYKAPCCGRTVDNRTWKSLPDMVPIERGELTKDRHGRIREIDGRYVKVRHAS